MSDVEVAHFVTVTWRGYSQRGIFCDVCGRAFRKEDGTQHTKAELMEILGPFWLVLAPKSEPFSKTELKAYSNMVPLPEYSSAYGIAFTDDDIEQLGKDIKENRRKRDAVH